MTKEELEKEAEELIQRVEMANSMNCFMQLTPDRKQIAEMLVMIAEPREKRITDLEVTNKNISNECHKLVDSLEKKQNEVAELENKLEQTEKDLADYQFNYPTIKELQKENAELKVRVENQKSFLERIRAKFNLGKIERKEIEGYLESDQLIKAKEIILKLYNAGRDVLMCRAEEKAYDNLDEAINDRSIEQFLKEVENDR